ncbi:MAG: hypothetical protein ACOH5I_26595 [Oligoflexus sp.]
MSKWDIIKPGLAGIVGSIKWECGDVDENIRQYSFDDAEYINDRNWISSCMEALDVPNKLRPALHIRILSKRWRVSPQTILANIVLDFNRWGLKFVCYKYRFNASHRFNWLPTDGDRTVSTGMVWNPAAKKMVRWQPRYGIPEDWCASRKLRTVPAGVADKKFPTAKIMHSNKGKPDLQTEEEAITEIANQLKNSSC